MSDNDATDFQKELSRRTGLSLRLLQSSAVAGFITRRCAAVGLADEPAYHQLLLGDGSETERLVEEVAVPETWFFRYPQSFELLVDHCKGLLQQNPRQLKMLSVACATGEEPYCMTMAAAEAGWPLNRVDVFAVDRHEASLASARLARFSDRSFRDSIPPWAEQWFRRSNGTRDVDAEIASRVRFFRHDILSESWPDPTALYDVVFCRNLFIYFGDTARRRLTDRLSLLLSDSGLLFVGHAEIPILSAGAFEPLRVKQAFAVRRKSKPSVSERIEVITEQMRTPPTDRPNRRLPIKPPSESVVDQETRTAATLQDARAMADAGHLDDALRALESLHPRHMADIEYFELLGTVKLSFGQLHHARDAFNKVLYFDPDHERALLQMAILHDRLGNAEQASRFRRRANRAHDQQQRQSSEERR